MLRKFPTVYSKLNLKKSVDSTNINDIISSAGRIVDSCSMDNSDENLRDLRNNIIHYILNSCCRKLPIKRSDIIKRLLDGKTTTLNAILPAVTTSLETTYGVQLVAVPDTNNPQYICVSSFPAASSIQFDTTQRSQITLLFLILSYIFMKGGTVEEENVELFLNGLDIHLDKQHPFFGENIKKLITEQFVKQLYLKRVKIDNGSIDSKIAYSWGFRSEKEFPKKDVLEAVAKILNRPAQDFALQYGQAQEAESSD